MFSYQVNMADFISENRLPKSHLVQELFKLSFKYPIKDIFQKLEKISI